jgi:DNA-binding MarR family transcriptional regulator
MATTAASYRNPQIPQPTIEQKEPECSLTPGEVAQTLDELIQLGFIEKFRDEYNITRYRAIGKLS